MTCPACEQAMTDPFAGLVYASCRGCDVRTASQAPGYIRKLLYAARPIDDVEQFKADVLAEFKRIESLRSRT